MNVNRPVLIGAMLSSLTLGGAVFFTRRLPVTQPVTMLARPVGPCVTEACFYWAAETQPPEKQNPEAWWQLGLYRREYKQHVHAQRHAFNRYLELAPDGEHADDARKILAGLHDDT